MAERRPPLTADAMSPSGGSTRREGGQRLPPPVLTAFPNSVTLTIQFRPSLSSVWWAEAVNAIAASSLHARLKDRDGKIP
jgi:hypothetical protein